MTTVTYHIPAIHCGHCIHTVQMEVAELEGVQSVVAEEATKNATITFGPPATEAQIIALLKEIHYPPEGHDLIELS